ncbi:porin [Marinibaculum pumilum]|uniref:Porin n=1 Tax=Marinibaculum pumilum TaxID=1766165 RepID=A0ABV7KYQ5_9PROT
MADGRAARHALLSATALVSVAVVMPQGLLAENGGAPIALKLGGEFYGAFSIADQTSGAGPDGIVGTIDDAPGQNRRNNGFLRVSRIFFSGDTKLDNGLDVGVLVKLNAEDCLDQIDEAFIWFESRLGRFEYGATDGVGDKMVIGSANPVAYLGLNTPDLLPANPTNSLGAGNLAATPVTTVDTATLERVNYFTPQIHGLQLGLSYVPVQCLEGNAGTTPCGGSYAGMPAGNIAQGYDYLQGAATYERPIGPVDLGLYAAYTRADTGSGVVAVPGVAGTGAQRQWGAGASIGYQGVALGGGYRRSLDDAFTADLNVTDWNASLTYATGPWSGGVQYASKEARLLARTDSFDGVSVGAAYQLGPGISLFGAAQYYDWSTNAAAAAVRSAATNEAWTLSLGAGLAF